MAKTSLLYRGFKSNAEKIAVSYREAMGLSPHSPMCAFDFAKHLKIQVFPVTEFPDINVKELDGWSALTMVNAKGSKIIIHNHTHSNPRQQSNIMHELAHIICEHGQPDSHKEVSLPYYMRGFNKQHEEEANYLGATLQITREGLLWSLKKRMDVSSIATHFNASEAMVKLRINSTGVKRQLNYLN